MLRRLLPVLVGLGACNTSDFTPAPPLDCTKTECTCEQEPSQPTCRGFSGQPEGGLPLSDSGPGLPDAADAADGEADAGDDGAVDAGEDADAS